MSNTITPATMDIPKDSNLLYFPAYYLLPESILKKSKRCRDLPRSPTEALYNSQCQEIINSEDFRYLVTEGIAQLAWPHIGIVDPMRAFSKYDPLYIWVHDTLPIIQRLKRHGYDLNILQNLPGDMQIITPTMEEAHETMDSAIKQLIAETNMAPVIDLIKKHRCEEDLSSHTSKAYIDYLRQKYRSRTIPEEASIDELGTETESKNTTELRLESEDVVDRFLCSLSEKDAKIITLRMNGLPHKEIAEKTGYKNHSSVIKRIAQIGQLWNEYNAA